MAKLAKAMKAMTMLAPMPMEAMGSSSSSSLSSLSLSSASSPIKRVIEWKYPKSKMSPKGPHFWGLSTKELFFKNGSGRICVLHLENNCVKKYPAALGNAQILNFRALFDIFFKKK